MSKSKIILFSGPSGVGKGTIRSLLDDEVLNLVNSVSWTTRAPRPGEVEGVSYHFVTPEEFQKNLNENGFVEYYAPFADNSYGTPRKPLEEWLAQGKNVLLEIDVNGALQVMEAYPEAESIFLAPPSMEELEARLVGRKTEDEKTIAKRLETAKKEMAAMHHYRHVVINDDPKLAADKVSQIIAEDN